MFDLLVLFLFFLICFVSFRNFQVGFAMIFLLDFFVPRSITFLGILPLRELFMVVAWSFFFYHSIIKKEYKLTFKGVYKKPLIIFTIGILLIFFFSSHVVSISIQLKHIFGLVYYFSYAYIAWTIYNDEQSITKFNKILFVASFFMAINGIISYVTSSNPYLSLLGELAGRPLIVGMDFERGGLSHRIQSTMSHPLNWAGCSGLLCFFFLNNSRKTVLKYILPALLCINLFLTGSRSAIIGLFASFAFLFLWRKKNIKITLSVILFSAILISSFYYVPQLSKYRGLLESSLFFWDNSYNSEIKGSTVNMREMQLLGTIQLVGDNLLFGLGHGYVDYTVSNFGPDPVLFGFEGLVFNKLAEGGIVDLLLWFYIFFILFNRIKKINKQLPIEQDTSILKTYIVFYFVFSLLTGFMQTFLCFIIIYVVLVKYMIVEGSRLEDTE